MANLSTPHFWSSLSTQSSINQILFLKNGTKCWGLIFRINTNWSWNRKHSSAFHWGCLYLQLVNASHPFRTMHATTNLCSPYGLLQRMKKFETKAIFFRRPLDEFTNVQQHCSYPLVIFGSFVKKQHSWFQYTPQFGPAFQGTTNLEDK